MTEPLESVDPAQSSQFASPWPVSERVRRVLWEFCWFIFCGWTPKPANPWRLFWLGVFDAKIDGTPFVHQRARIAVPWNLTLHDRACLGDRANAIQPGRDRNRSARRGRAGSVSEHRKPRLFAALHAAGGCENHDRRRRLCRRAGVCHARDQNRGARDCRGVFGRDQRCAGKCGRGGKPVPDPAPAERQPAASLTTNIYITVAVSPNFFARSSRCSSMYFVWPKIRVITRKSGFLNSATSVSTIFEPASAGEIS